MMPAPRGRRFQSILCAVDFTPLSRSALRYAAALAHACGGTVTALFVAEAPAAGAPVSTAETMVRMQTAKREMARFLVMSLGQRAARSVVPLVRAGIAGGVIVEEAGRLGADVIVLGKRSRRAARSVAFGATTQTVLGVSRVAVLVVPQRAAGPRRGWPRGRILAVADDGVQRCAELTAAARMAEAFGAWLSLAPVAPGPTARVQEPEMIIYPLPNAERRRTFRDGSDAYRFVCGASAPVLVIGIGRARSAGLRRGVRAA